MKVPISEERIREMYEPISDQSPHCAAEQFKGTVSEARTTGQTNAFSRFESLMADSYSASTWDMRKRYKKRGHHQSLKKTE